MICQPLKQAQLPIRLTTASHKAAETTIPICSKADHPPRRLATASDARCGRHGAC